MYDYFIYLVLLAGGALLGYVVRGRLERGRRAVPPWPHQSDSTEREGGSYVQQRDPAPPTWARVPRSTSQLGPDPMQQVEALRMRLSGVEGRVQRLEDVLANRRDEKTRTEERWSREPDSRRSANPESGEPSRRPPLPRREANSYAAAQESYLKIFTEVTPDLPVQPLFVTLESDGVTGAIGESVRRFRQSESRHQVFVVFPKAGGGGWLYPNPRHPYTESMHYVFPELTRDNYNEVKPVINPLPARLIEDGLWETLTG
jgi:hypothetical protein